MDIRFNDEVNGVKRLSDKSFVKQLMMF